MAWTRCEPLVACAGDIGGDCQATEAYSARFLWGEPVEGSYLLATVAFYGVRAGAGYQIEQQTELLICDDPSDPGGSERWSDYRYEWVPGACVRLEDAEAAAQALALSVTSAVVPRDALGALA